MNSKYLGDALDHWKGSLISALSQKKLIRNIVVEPMITDATAWLREDLNTYKRLLNLDSTRSICHGNSTFLGKRDKYFTKLLKVGDVFLDPDTGIATGDASKVHIKISELGKLIIDSDRVLMVYQHSAPRFHKS